jgi:hypothetical protein
MFATGLFAGLFVGAIPAYRLSDIAVVTYLTLMRLRQWAGVPSTSGSKR